MAPAFGLGEPDAKAGIDPSNLYELLEQVDVPENKLKKPPKPQEVEPKGVPAGIRAAERGTQQRIADRAAPTPAVNKKVVTTDDLLKKATENREIRELGLRSKAKPEVRKFVIVLFTIL